MTKEIRVWDPLVRIFHWSLVLAFTIGFLTGDEKNTTHIYAGYVVLGLISFRIVWGLIGTRHALFSDFIYSPTRVLQYLRELLENKPKHYTGHNPAGGWMVILILISLFVVSWSGLKVYAQEEGKGPLASNYLNVSMISIARADSDDKDDDEEHEYLEYYGENGEEEREGEIFWEELHEGSANFMLLLIILHVLGVLISGVIHDENLVKAMITGFKKR